VDYAGIGVEPPETPPEDTPVVDPDTSPGVVPDAPEEPSNGDDETGVPEEAEDVSGDDGDVEPGDAQGGQGAMIMAGLVLVLLIGAAVAFYIYRGGRLSK